MHLQKIIEIHQFTLTIELVNLKINNNNNKFIKFKSCMQPPGTYIVPEFLDIFFWFNRITPPRGSTLALWNLKRPAQTHLLSFSPALSWTLAQVPPYSHIGWGGRQQALKLYEQEAESIPQGLRAFILTNILPRICFWRFSLVFLRTYSNSKNKPEKLCCHGWRRGWKIFRKMQHLISS